MEERVAPVNPCGEITELDLLFTPGVREIHSGAR